MREVCGRHEHILKEGPVALLHRIVDTMVDNYRPVIEELEDRIGKLEEQAFAGHERLVAPGHEAQTGSVVDAAGHGAAARRDRPAGAP